MSVCLFMCLVCSVQVCDSLALGWGPNSKGKGKGHFILGAGLKVGPNLSNFMVGRSIMAQNLAWRI